MTDRNKISCTHTYTQNVAVNVYFCFNSQVLIRREEYINQMKSADKLVYARSYSATTNLPIQP
jgi:hypothetical protein